MKKYAFRAACGVGLVTSAVMTFIYFKWPTAGFSGWLDNVGNDVSPLLVAPPLCLWAGLRSRGSRRAGWWLLGGSALAWAIGEAVYTFIFNVSQPCVSNPDACPNPSYADLFFLAAVPIGIAGLLMLPGKARSFADLVRQVLDGVLIGASILFISWAFAFRDLYNYNITSGLSKVATLVGLAYPVSDIIMATLAISAFTRMRRGRLAPTLLVFGFIALGVSDTVYNYQVNVVGQSNYVAPTDVGWYVGYFLVGLAALLVVLHGNNDHAAEDERGASLVQTVTPYVPLVGVAVATVHAVQIREWGPVLAWTGIAIIAALLLRQVMTLAENMRLNRGLESKVVARTEQLMEGRARLRASEERFRSLVQNSSDVITIMDTSYAITYQTNSVETVLGYPAESLNGTSFLELIADAERPSFTTAVLNAASGEADGTRFASIECHVRDNSGKLRYVEIRITSLVEDLSVNGLVLNIRDITDRKALEEQLTHQAFHDQITGLPNRVLFRERLDYELLQRSRNKSNIAVFFLDVDGFKSINDSMGHTAGDQLLALLGKRIAKATRLGDTVARLGGDEFAVLAEGITARRNVGLIADRILKCLKPAFNIDGREIFIHGSIGIATRVDGTETAEDLMRNADLAMYRAKERNPGSYQIYESDLQSTVETQFAMQSAMQNAVERNEFVLYYQPLLELATGRILGFESLIRWIRPEVGMVPPLEFIPIAEQTGLIVPIGRWVLQTACEQVQRWREQTESDLHISVNLSMRQLRDPALFTDVKDTLRKVGLPARCLTLEVTESMLVENFDEAMKILNKLRGLGVKLSLDDFGTGYSSFSYLRQIPVNEIKIDRSFVNSLSDDASASVLVKSIVDLGDNLGLKVVAEGIETHAQLDELVGMGCHLGQGYLYSPPKPPDEAFALISKTFVIELKAKSKN